MKVENIRIKNRKNEFKKLFVKGFIRYLEKNKTIKNTLVDNL